MRLFEKIIPATFLARPNRFVVECLVRGRKVRAYLPNPGRLWELFFPGVRLLLTRLPPDPDRKLAYLAVAVEREGLPIMLHTHHTDTVAAHLIRSSLVPGLEGAEIVQPEYRIGRSRFDFLLRKDGRDILLEVKSCTLFNDTLAMFPDAVSARATKHLRELAELSRKGYGTAVLFVVHSPRVRWFMPEHHTDLLFTRTLCDVRDRVMVRAVSVEWANLYGQTRDFPEAQAGDVDLLVAPTAIAPRWRAEARAGLEVSRDGRAWPVVGASLYGRSRVGAWGQVGTESVSIGVAYRIR